jgi:predicted nucleic acid-binding Zn ribbon protein
MPITEEHKRRRGRNFTLAGFLALLVVLFFVVTIVKMGGAS